MPSPHGVNTSASASFTSSLVAVASERPIRAAVLVLNEILDELASLTPVFVLDASKTPSFAAVAFLGKGRGLELDEDSLELELEEDETELELDELADDDDCEEDEKEDTLDEDDDTLDDD